MVAAAAQAIAGGAVATAAGGAADIRSEDCSAVRNFTGELRCVVDTVAADGLTYSGDSSPGGLVAALVVEAASAGELTAMDAAALVNLKRRWWWQRQQVS